MEHARTLVRRPSVEIVGANGTAEKLLTTLSLDFDVAARKNGSGSDAVVVVASRDEYPSALRDPHALRRNPLAQRFFGADAGSEASACARVRATVRSALPEGTHARRIVERCDIGGENHKAVMLEMGLSRRQFYRERREAAARVLEVFEGGALDAIREPRDVLNDRIDGVRVLQLCVRYCPISSQVGRTSPTRTRHGLRLGRTYPRPRQFRAKSEERARISSQLPGPRVGSVFRAKSPMNDAEALRELHAESYPLAAAAIRRHGLRWTGEREHIDDLDWPNLLVALHARGFVVPGPTVDHVSFWYVTRRCMSDFGVGFWYAVRELVGAGWSAAVTHRFQEHLWYGPRPRNWKIRPCTAHRSMPAPNSPRRVRYAFRARNEPTAWPQRRGAVDTGADRSRLDGGPYRGSSRLTWRTIPAHGTNKRPWVQPLHGATRASPSILRRSRRKPSVRRPSDNSPRSSTSSRPSSILRTNSMQPRRLRFGSVKQSRRFSENARIRPANASPS